MFYLGLKLKTLSNADASPREPGATQLAPPVLTSTGSARTMVSPCGPRRGSGVGAKPQYFSVRNKIRSG